MAPSVVPSSFTSNVPMSNTPVPSPSAQTSENELLRIGIDLGTGRTRVYYQYIHGEYTQESAPIEPVKLKKNQDAALQQIMILREDGSVIYGCHDVKEEIGKDPSLQDKAIRRMKLALHDDFRDLADVRHAKKVLHARLDRGALQDAFEDFLRAVIKDTRAFVKRRKASAGKPHSYWDEMPLEMQISVPAMWNDIQRGIVRNAARGATRIPGESWKIPRLELREEALCVATPYMIKKESADEGSLTVFVDCGDGTLDITTLELERAHSNGGPMQLRRIGICSGNGAGAHMVNAEAAKWLLKRSGIQQHCKELAISERELLRQFNDQLDMIKKTRIGKDQKEDTQTVTIESSHGKAGAGYRNELIIRIPYPTIMLWYNTWTDAAAGLLEDHLAKLDTSRHVSAILTGGGSNSTIFCERMDAILAEREIDSESDPCADECGLGTLMQHYFQADQLPLRANFYVTVHEYYDEDIHMDTVEADTDLFVDHNKEDHIERGEVTIDEAIVIQPKERFLPERLRKVGTYSNERFSSMEPIPMMFHVDADGKHLGRLHVDLYWSERNFEEHSSLRDDAGNWFPEIRSYPLMFADLEDLKGQGFEVDDSEDTVIPYYPVRAYVEMTGSSDSLLLSLHVMKHYYLFPTEGGPPFNQEHLLLTHTQEVWSQGCSHFTSNTTGTSGSHGAAVAVGRRNPLRGCRA